MEQIPAVLTIDCPEFLQALGAEVVYLSAFVAGQRRSLSLGGVLALERLEQERSDHRVAHHQAAQTHVREQVREEHLDVVTQSVALLAPLHHGDLEAAPRRPRHRG